MKNLLLRIAGKPDFVLDHDLPLSYLLRICVTYGLMKIRGLVSALPYSNISNNVFIGKRVTLRCKKQIRIEGKVKLHDNVFLDALSTERIGIHLADGVVIGRNSRIECTGTISALGKSVVVGKNSSFGSDCFFGGAGGIKIGNDVVAGQYVRFHSENHNYNALDTLIRKQGVSHKGITIGNNCWIGAGAVFLDGASLGDGCVVAANSVVCKGFPENCVIGGIPAKIIKKRGLDNE